METLEITQAINSLFQSLSIAKNQNEDVLVEKLRVKIELYIALLS